MLKQGSTTGNKRLVLTIGTGHLFGTGSHSPGRGHGLDGSSMHGPSSTYRQLRLSYTAV